MRSDEVLYIHRHGPTRYRWTEGRALALQADLKVVCGDYYDVTRSKRGLRWEVETWTKPRWVGHNRDTSTSQIPQPRRFAGD